MVRMAWTDDKKKYKKLKDKRSSYCRFQKMLDEFDEEMLGRCEDDNSD